MPVAPVTVTELEDFPFASFEEFCEASREGRTRVRIRYDFRSAWVCGERADRLFQAALLGLPAVAAIVFAVLAVAMHDRWYWWGIPAALLGFLSASPTPGLISGGGCVANSLFAAGFIGSVFLDRTLLWAGLTGTVCWFLASTGQGVADVTVRNAMVKSEQMFLWLCGRRAVTSVERVDEPQKTVGGN